MLRRLVHFYFYFLVRHDRDLMGLNCAVRDIFSKPIKSVHKQSVARALRLRRVWVSAPISAVLLKVVWD